MSLNARFRRRISPFGRPGVLIAAALLLLAAAGVPALPGAGPGPLAAQPASGEEARTAASRVASLLELALEEYGAAVAGGEIVNQMEYDESRAFTRQARDRYRGLLESTSPADRPAGAGDLTARFDSLLAIVDERGKTARFRSLVGEMVDRLGSLWGAASLSMPSRHPSVVRGAAIYRQACAACHGPRGEGDGWAAGGMSPPPPDLTSGIRRAEATPARDYQVITYGVPRTAMPESGDWLDVNGRWDVVAYLGTLRYSAAEVAEGKGLATGSPAPSPLTTGEALPAEGSSPLAGWMREWGSPEATARLTDPELARRVRSAWERGSAAGEDSLSERQVRSAVAYARYLMGTPHAGAPEADRSVRVSRTLAEIDTLLARSVRADREGETGVARGLAIESYMSFERLEPELRARSPGLTASAEAAFNDFRAALGGGGVGPARDTLDRRLDQVETELTAVSSDLALAGQSFFIILREGFEAILLIGAIIAFLVKTGNGEKRRTVYTGVWWAVAASAATAVAIETVLTVTPADQEVLEGVTMLLATAVLFSVSYWILSKLEHEKWEAYLRDRLDSALGKGGGLALAGVAFLAVYREGFETVLFYKALVISGGGRWVPLVGGFLVGALALAVIYVLFTRYGVKIPMRPFFAVTSGVLYYMAVVFVGQGIHELQQAGTVGLTPVGGVPRLPLLGLHPTVQTLTAQGVMLLLLVGALVHTFGPWRQEARTAGS